MHGTWIDAISEYTLALRTGDYPREHDQAARLPPTPTRPVGRVGVSEVTTDHVQAFLDQPGWAPSYRRTYRVTFRHFFRWARSAGVTHAKPMKGIMSSSAPLGKPRPAPESAVLEGQRYHDTRVRTMVRLARTSASAAARSAASTGTT